MKVMKIKDILLLSIATLTTLSLGSCQNDEDDIFGDSSSLRLQQALNETKSVLRGAEYGWVMDYYIGDAQEYGGRAMTVKFDSLTCTVASESMPEECSSYYKMTTDQGAVLTFDTYNKVLHELSTPSSSNYEAYHADFEFMIESATPELVVLRGKRTGNYSYLRPLKEPALDYLKKVAAVEDSIYAATAVGMMGEDSIVATFDYNMRQLTFSSPNNASVVSQSIAYTYTDSGIRLYEDAEIGTAKLSDFSYASDGMKFTSLNEGSGNFVMNGVMPEDYVEYDMYAGNYVLNYFIQDGNELLPLTINVTLTPSEDGTSYLMSGLNPNFDVVLNYSRQSGSLEWNTQVVGQQGENLIWLNAADMSTGGSLYPGYTGAGMITKWNGDEENVAFDWVSNGDINTSTDSFCFWLTDANGNSLGQFREWSINGYSIITYVTSMTKTK